jgi:hypothetical protein
MDIQDIPSQQSQVDFQVLKVLLIAGSCESSLGACQIWLASLN